MPRFGHRVDKTNPIMRGCVGWWPLNDGAGSKAVDLSGNGNDAVVTTGLPTWGTTEKGVALSGGNPLEAPAFPVTNVDAFSIVAWIDSNGSNGNWLGSWSSEQPINAVLIRKNLLEALVRNAANTSDDTIALSTSLSSIGTGLVQVALVVDSGNAKLYANGELNQEDASFMAGPYISASATEFGFGNARVTSFPAGSNIQNVRVYDRALSATEVSRLYTEPWAGLEPLSPFSFFSGLSQIYAYYSAAFLQRLG